MSPSAAESLHTVLASEMETRRLGTALAKCLTAGLHINLQGELGAGKTTLVRAILEALGYQGRVKSPTYTLVELYAISRLNLYHFDFYRFRDAHEWRDAGFSDHFDGDAVCLVEWPEKAGDDLPTPDLTIRLGRDDDNLSTDARLATVTAHTDLGQQCVASLKDSDWRERPC